MPVKREGLNERQLLWEISKADQNAKRIGKKYDQAIELLTYYTNTFKRLYPKQWDAMLLVEEKIQEQIRKNNEAVDAKNAEAQLELPLEGNK